MILAAVLGVVGGAGAAFAQAPQPMPATPGAVPVVVAPAQPVLAAPHIVAPAPVNGGCCGSVAPAPADCGGCDSDCTSSKGRKHHRNGGGLFHKAAIGEGCANPIGCGSCASEKTFLFGGCDQFFNPGDKCGHGMGGGCNGGGCLGGLRTRLRGDCAIAPVGTGGLNSPPCTYTSYVNRYPTGDRSHRDRTIAAAARQVVRPAGPFRFGFRAWVRVPSSRQLSPVDHAHDHPPQARPVFADRHGPGVRTDRRPRLAQLAPAQRHHLPLLW
jgi:hypothetical protein